MRRRPQQGGDAWESAFDAAGVDLVINGHNHSYERTHPMRAGEPAVAAPVGAEISPALHGTTYVTAGAGGQAPYPSTLFPASYVTNPLGARVPEVATWSSVRYLGDHSLLIADAAPAVGSTPARLAVRVVAQDTGLAVDSFSLVR